MSTSRPDSDNRFRIACEITNQLIFESTVRADGQGSVDWIDGQVKEIAGVHPEDFLGRNWANLTHPDDLPIIGQIVQDLMDGRTSVAESRIITGSGEVRWIRSVIKPLELKPDGTRRAIGAIADISERKREEERYRNQHRFLNAVIQCAAEGICVCQMIDAHPGIRFTVWNPAMTALTGYTMDEINRNGWYQTVYPDRETQEMARLRMEQMNVGLDLETEEWVITTKGGDRRALLISTRIITGQPEGNYILGVLHDITARREAETRQRLLMRELDHRVRNNLASVLALAQHTCASSSSLHEFEHVFVSRLHTMLRAHEMLAASQWLEMPLDRLVRTILAPFLGGSDSRITMQAADLWLTPRAVLPLGLILHELATNAVKHGALRSSSGRIEIEAQALSHELVEIRWVEHHQASDQLGPSAPSGTGLDLIRGFIEHELRGRFECRCAPEGAKVTIVLPAFRRTSPAGVVTLIGRCPSEDAASSLRPDLQPAMVR